jgi:hypothetical protein
VKLRHRGIAEAGGFGTLAYLLDLATIEARLQVRNADESRSNGGSS